MVVVVRLTLYSWPRGCGSGSQVAATELRQTSGLSNSVKTAGKIAGKTAGKQLVKQQGKQRGKQRKNSGKTAEKQRHNGFCRNVMLRSHFNTLETTRQNNIKTHTTHFTKNHRGSERTNWCHAMAYSSTDRHTDRHTDTHTHAHTHTHTHTHTDTHTLSHTDTIYTCARAFDMRSPWS